MGDIALIQLKEQVRYNEYVQPIALVDTEEQFPVGSECVITGWGDYLYDGSKFKPCRAEVIVENEKYIFAFVTIS